MSTVVRQSFTAWRKAWKLLACGTGFLIAILSVAGVSVSAQTYSVIYSFPGGTEGAFPYGSVTRSHTGVIYGSTYKTDGANGGTGFGVAYSVTATGTEKVLQSFQGPPNDGANPKGGMIHFHGLYSTTTSGGSSTNCTGGCGVVWTHNYNAAVHEDDSANEDPASFDVIIHNFTGLADDGAAPVGDLARDFNYNLYGVTTYGGDTQCSAQGCGIIYELTLAGVETIFHKFSGPDGSFPRSGLISCRPCGTTVNHLFGTTSAGGASNQGTLFTIDMNGQYFQTLYQFKGGADGSEPEGAVVLDLTGNGNIYGTTVNGGGSTNCPGGCGTVYKVTPSGEETVLYAFTGGADGAHPRGTLAIDTKGNIYGATSDGGKGKPGDGVIFEVNDTTGAETVIHTFAGGADGANPFGGVVKDVFGNLYGTTVYGGDMSCGTNGCGVIFTATPASAATPVASK